MTQNLLIQLDSNPYLKAYKALKIDIHPDINKENAELVATQICLIHNTMGIVIKDLFKILTTKFNNNSAPKEDIIKKDK